MKIDFTNVQGGSFDALPSGTYDAFIYDVQQKESQNSEYDYLAWTFKIDGGEHDGRQQWLNTSFSPKALWKLKEVLEAATQTPITGELNITPAEYIGKRVKIVLGQRQWEGQTQNEVKKVLAAVEGSSPSPNSAPKKKAPKSLL